MNAKRQPKHRIIYELIRQLILSNVYARNHLIPGEQSLATQFNVSRTTARRALQDLAEDSFLKPAQGKGYYVTYDPSRVSESCMSSFTDTALQNGLIPSTKIISFTTESSCELATDFLQAVIEVDTILVKIERIRYINQKPVLLNTVWLPSKIVPNISPSLFPLKGEGQSILRVLKAHYGLSWKTGVEQITPVLPNDEDAKNLEISVNQPVLQQCLVVYDQDKNLTYLEKNIRTSNIRFSLSHNQKLRRWSRD